MTKSSWHDIHMGQFTISDHKDIHGRKYIYKKFRKLGFNGHISVWLKWCAYIKI